MSQKQALFTDAAKERLTKTKSKHLTKILSKFERGIEGKQLPSISAEQAIKLCLDPDTLSLIHSENIDLLPNTEQVLLPVETKAVEETKTNDIDQEAKQKQIIDELR